MQCRYFTDLSYIYGGMGRCTNVSSAACHFLGASRNAALLGDLWAWDLSARVWAPIAPSSGPQPAPRFSASLVALAASSPASAVPLVLYLYGGYGPLGPRQDLWRLVPGGAWVELLPAGFGPGFVSGHTAFAVGSPPRRMVVLGGATPLGIQPPLAMAHVLTAWTDGEAWEAIDIGAVHALFSHV